MADCSELSIESVFYNLPQYYDLAFERDISGEMAFYERCFKRYAPEIPVKRIIEPACGTGILLETLGGRGYQCMGYDLSEEMVSYSNSRLKEKGLHRRAKAVLGDMKSRHFTKKFDAAIICINSLGYLTRNEDITSHFKAVARSLVLGGLYIVEIGCACEDIKNEKRPDESWTVERGSIKLHLTWAPSKYDYDKRLRHVEFVMKGYDQDQEIEVEEAHDLRLWIYEEFVQLARSGGFQLVGIYTQAYKEIPLSQKITGELGVLYFVLKNETHPRGKRKQK